MEPYNDMMCEGKRSGGYPEVGSTVTSLIIMWCGIHMLLFWRTDAQLLLVIGASFVANGWSAMIAHASGDATASIIDRWSLVLTAWLVVAYILDEFTEALVTSHGGSCSSAFRAGLASKATKAAARESEPEPRDPELGTAADGPKWTHSSSSSLRSRSPSRMSQEERVCVLQLHSWPRLLSRGFGYIACVSAAWVFLAFDAQNHDQSLIELAFGLPLGIAVVLGISVYCLDDAVMKDELEAARKAVARGRTAGERRAAERNLADLADGAAEWRWAYSRLMLGLVAAALGILCNFLTERYCEASRFFAYFPGHALWHVLSSWGLLNCLVLAAMLRLDNMADKDFRRLPHAPERAVAGDGAGAAAAGWARAWHALATVYFALLPGFEFVPAGEAAEPEVRQRAATDPTGMAIGRAAKAEAAPAQQRRRRFNLRAAEAPRGEPTASELTAKLASDLAWLDRDEPTAAESAALAEWLRAKASELDSRAARERASSEPPRVQALGSEEGAAVVPSAPAQASGAADRLPARDRPPEFANRRQMSEQL